MGQKCIIRKSYGTDQIVWLTQAHTKGRQVQVWDGLNLLLNDADVKLIQEVKTMAEKCTQQGELNEHQLDRLVIQISCYTSGCIGDMDDSTSSRGVGTATFG